MYLFVKLGAKIINSFIYTNDNWIYYYLCKYLLSFVIYILIFINFSIDNQQIKLV
jgi:hypothetical protein